jgi:hypothetical protein
MYIKTIIVPETQAEVARLATLLGQLGMDNPNQAKPAQVAGNQASSAQVKGAAPTAAPAKEVTPVKEEEKKVAEQLVENDSETEVTMEDLKQMVQEKAKAGHRDAIRTKLDEYKVGGVAGLKEDKWNEFHTFLSNLA